LIGLGSFVLGLILGGIFCEKPETVEKLKYIVIQVDGTSTVIDPDTLGAMLPPASEGQESSELSP
jgi:hypothetical protein